VPLANFSAEGELTTPTGAALVATLVDTFGPLPAMTIEQIGYGAGQKDFDHANLLRLVVGESGETHSATTASQAHSPTTETIVLLETNLDDTPGEALGYCSEQLWAAGALDVSMTALQMKKGRPGVLLSVLAKPENSDELQAILFRETSTLGVRRLPVERTTLARETHEVQTPWGPVTGKVATLPDGSQKFSPEYEACRQLAQTHGATLAQIQHAASQAFCEER